LYCFDIATQFQISVTLSQTFFMSNRASLWYVEQGVKQDLSVVFFSVLHRRFPTRETLLLAKTIFAEKNYKHLIELMSPRQIL